MPLLALAAAGCLGLGAAPPAAHTASLGPLLTVPWMEPPTLDARLDAAEWAAALEVPGEIVIDDGSAVAGTYPLRLLLGKDERNVYVAVELQGMGPNPFTRETDGSRELFFDYVHLFLNADDDRLVAPADWKALGTDWIANSWLEDGYWAGGAWAVQQDIAGQSKEEHGRPDDGAWAKDGGSDSSLFWEVYLPRASDQARYDGPDLASDSPFRLAVMLERQDEDTQGSHGGHRDVFPGDGATPDGHLLATTWLRLAFGADPA